MAQKDIEPGSAQAKTDRSPGRLIAAGREAKSISPTELAARLRLDTKIVQALERDDFENLPEPMFIKGYIRSIAKELDMDPVGIVDAYENHATVTPPTLADFTSRAPVQVGINSAVIKAITYGLIAILTLLIVAWWRSNNDELTTTSTISTKSIEHVSADHLPNNFPEIQDDADRWLLELPANVQPSETILGEAQIETSIEAGLGLENRLQIETKNEAWIEIYDTDGKRLYYGTATAGKPIDLAGEQYYRLILGNSDSITLHHNDSEIDLSRYSVAGVAQLELGTKLDDGQEAQ